MVNRYLVTIVLLPIGLFCIAMGGWFYGVMIVAFLGMAAWEYVQMFRTGGLQPAGVLVVGGVLALLIGRAFDGFASAAWIASLLILLSMAWHLVAYERGRDQAATDFAITLAGIFYIGWLGAYLISLRDLPEGKWWLLIVLPAVWLADGGAYTIGVRFGRHKISPRLSPKKSWEGYLAGIVWAAFFGGLLATLWQFSAEPGTAVNTWHGVILGVFIGVFSILGDLGESMIKRQLGLKDSGNLLPGHGGLFDRIDSWLWAGVIGYYVIAWLFIKL